MVTSGVEGRVARWVATGPVSVRESPGRSPHPERQSAAATPVLNPRKAEGD
jgi:hypothetical protein